MCLGIPGRIIELFEENGIRMGRADFGGVSRDVCTDHLPDLRVGDYAIIHVGFALTRIDEGEAQRIFRMLAGTNELDELSHPPSGEPR